MAMSETWTAGWLYHFLNPLRVGRGGRSAAQMSADCMAARGGKVQGMPGDVQEGERPAPRVLSGEIRATPLQQQSREGQGAGSSAKSAKASSAPPHPSPTSPTLLLHISRRVGRISEVSPTDYSGTARD